MKPFRVAYNADDVRRVLQLLQHEMGAERFCSEAEEFIAAIAAQSGVEAAAHARRALASCLLAKGKAEES